MTLDTARKIAAAMNFFGAGCAFMGFLVSAIKGEPLAALFLASLAAMNISIGVVNSA